MRKPRLVMVLALQEAAVLVEDVVDGIAGQAFERRVGVDQDAVAAFLFGDDDAVVGGLDHQLQKLCVDH
jgi:hypothetical protein